MRLPKYPLKAEASFTTFEFISEGPNGLIHKLIQFQPTNQEGLYNLAFGDKNPQTGEVDDLAVSNNADTDKVLPPSCQPCMPSLTNTPMPLCMLLAAPALAPGSTEWASPVSMRRSLPTSIFMAR
jgi:hypothetical protein